MSPGGSQDDEEEPFDWEKVAGYVRFVLGALRRHAFLALGILVFGCAATYFVYWLLPRSYHVEAQLLAQKSPTFDKIAGGGNDQSPTRAAAEIVLRHDNLVELAKKSDVAANWDGMRSNAARLKDWIKLKLGRVPSEEDKVDVIVGTLESRLMVDTKSDWGGEGTVTIMIDWPDPKMGYRLVNAAQQSFIEARHLSEVSSITDGMSLLLGRAASLRDEIDGTLKKIESKRGGAAKKRAPGEVAERRPAAAAAAPDADLVPVNEREATQQLHAMWEAKKTAIKDLEDMRRKRIAELQTRLAELRATYADNHPAIQDTIQTIDTLSQESPQLAQLHREEAALHDQVSARAGRLGGTESLSKPILRSSSNSVRAAAEPETGDDRETEFAKAQLRFEAKEYDSLLERIENAHMQLETARTAFKHRYLVVKPAQIPRVPDKPKAQKILGGGIAAALALALLAAIAADLRSGRVYERWQLERALRLPVVAEIRRDS